ncbi:MAG: 23S rRNA (pseudouridine(1915)-N(3))-methyltransferase RlmH [Candidatus Falkowbacteria bacterium]
MLDITIVAIGKIKEKNIGASLAEYQKRLAPYAKLNLVELKPEPFSEGSRAKARITESGRIAEALVKYNSASIWLLTETGKEYDSFGFAEMLEHEQRPLVFAVGGALGWSESILKKYRNHLSLSRLTLPHELARLVFYEQMYRAATIIANKTYHY